MMFRYQEGGGEAGGGEAGGGSQGSCPVTVLASEVDDVIFMAQFVDTPWVVYADLAHMRRISTQVV